MLACSVLTGEEIYEFADALREEYQEVPVEDNECCGCEDCDTSKEVCCNAELGESKRVVLTMNLVSEEGDEDPIPLELNEDQLGMLIDRSNRENISFEEAVVRSIRDGIDALTAKEDLELDDEV